MGRVIGFFIAVLILGAVAGVAYQIGASVAYEAGATAGAAAPVAAAYYWHPFAFGFFPLFGLFFPILFIFLIFGAARAAFGGHGRHWDRTRIFEDWHRQAHERGSGKAES